MPNTHETLTSLFGDIATAIRNKTGSQAQITADNFPSAIANIPGSGTGWINSITYVESKCAPISFSAATKTLTFSVAKDSTTKYYLFVFQTTYDSNFPGAIGDWSSGTAYILVTPTGAALYFGRNGAITDVSSSLSSGTIKVTTTVSRNLSYSQYIVHQIYKID